MTYLDSNDEIVICDTDSESGSNDLYDEDGEFMDAEKTDGSYYIGLAGYVPNQPEPIL